MGPKSPPMDWGWPSGYFFVVTGFTDSNNDNNPDTHFELQALGDQMLSPVDQINITPVGSNDTIYIDLKVNRKISSPNTIAAAQIIVMCNNSYQMNVFETFNGFLLI